MDIRGQRECKSCGARWSYYETGDVACPECGSLRSVGRGDRRTHTSSQATLDLTAIRTDVETEPLRRIADRAADATREYVASVGFVHAGELQPLDDTFLAAMELRRIASTLGRVSDVTDDEVAYLLQLLRGADSGERPEPAAVPETLHPERGLAIAASIDTYQTDIGQWDDDHEPAVDRLLSVITTRRKRIEALDGAVDPREAERLLETVRDLSRYLRDNDETALARAQERISTTER